MAKNVKRKKDDKQELVENQTYLVVKSNELIQKSRFNLSLQEQKIILYLISKIKPKDMEIKEHSFEIADFCRVCGLDENNGANYKYIKQTLKDLRDKSVWVEIEKGTETTLSWVNSVTVTQRSGIVKIKLDDMMKPYLIQLREKFTQYELFYTLSMKSQYSIRLYELLKSYEHVQGQIFTVEELKKKLNAENYERFHDFQRKVIDIALREINELSDINVTCIFTKEGRRYAKTKFNVKLKKDLNERLKTWQQIELNLGGKNKTDSM
jgi:plasmid replication initiation protein